MYICVCVCVCVRVCLPLSLSFPLSRLFWALTSSSNPMIVTQGPKISSYKKQQKDKTRVNHNSEPSIPKDVYLGLKQRKRNSCTEKLFVK